MKGCVEEHRFGFEEAAWLLLVGKLPTQAQLTTMRELMTLYRELPDSFAEDVLMKTPSNQLMIQLSRGVLGLYFYDENERDYAKKLGLSQRGVNKRRHAILAKLKFFMKD